MAVAEEQKLNAETTALASGRDEHRLAAVACGAHALHDGFTDLIYVLLPLGTALSGIGYCFVGASGSLTVLMLALFSAGLGSSTQHPLASSLMAHAFAGARSMKAIGTYNFAGDIGKMTIPAIASLLLVMLPWRPVLALFGILGIVVGVVIYILTPQLAGPSATGHGTPVSEGKRASTVHWIAFPTLTAIA